MDQSFKDLLEASSLGTPAARRIRSSTPSEVVDDVRLRMEHRRELPLREASAAHHRLTPAKIIGELLTSHPEAASPLAEASHRRTLADRSAAHTTKKLAAAQAARIADERARIADETTLGSLKHRRLPRWIRHVPKLVVVFDFCLLLYFFSGMTNVNWASPLSVALVFAGLLAAMVTSISFASFRFTGDRLQRYKDDTGTIRLRDLDEATTVSIGLALGALMILAALMFIRMRAEVLNALGPDADGTAIIIGLAVALISILANAPVIAIHALDGSTETDRLHALGRATYQPLAQQHAQLEQAEALDPRITAIGRKAERAATEGITKAGHQHAADGFIDAARAVHQGTGPLSDPAADPNSQHSNIGYRHTDASPEVDKRPVHLALDHVHTLLPGEQPGDEPEADKHRARRARRYSRRFRPSRLTDAIVLVAAVVIAIAVVVTVALFGFRFPSTSAAASPGTSVVIAATATANEPAPTLPTDILQTLLSTADSSTGATAYVVSPSDGQPTVLPLTPRSANANPARGEALKANVAAVEQALENEAAAGQLDMLATITAATRAASPPATLIVISSGLSTTGGFDLRQVGWDVDPSTLAAHLKASELLPDLAGWRVVFAGLGDVAGLQPTLPQPQQVTLAAYWTAICQASGAASCSVDKTARPQLASHVTSTAPVVSVPVVTSARGPAFTSLTTLPDTLLFPFNSSTLVPSADTILQPIVEKARSQHLLVSITGYTSPDGGNNAYNLALSAQRADAVRDRLIALGLPTEQITQVTGAGTGGKGPDACIVNGHMDEAICAQLRRVVVVLSPAKANP